MIKISYLVLAMLSLLMLGGCKKSYTHEYLLRHPRVLQAEVNQCRENAEYTDYCDRVKQTQDDFLALVSLRQDDPELFGKEILKAEAALAEYKTQLKLAQSEDQKTQLLQSYQTQLQKVQTLLAVIAGTSWEGL